MTIRLAEETQELEVTATGIRWAGRTDPEPDAPIVACEYPVPLEARAIADLVAREPIPSTLLRELAARCPPGDDAHADPRWRQARAAAAIAAGASAVDTTAGRGTPIDRGVEEVRTLRDGTVVYIRGTTLVIGDRPPIALPVAEHAMYVLPAPLLDDTDEIIVLVYGRAGTTLIEFTSDGREVARQEAPLAFLPNKVAKTAAGYWVSSDSNHHLVGTNKTLRRPFMRNGVAISGGWLLEISKPILAWVELASGKRRPFDWHATETRETARSGDILYCMTEDGLWRLQGGERPVRVWAGNAWGLAVHANHAWLGLDDSSVIAIDLTSGAQLWRSPIPHKAYSIRAFDTVVIAMSFDRCTLLTPDGRVLSTSEERRDVGVAQLADGTVGISCGEQLFLVESMGVVRRGLSLPYDGMILHATTDRFIFGPVSGGEARVSPTELVAFDRTGRVTSRLVPPDRPRFMNDTHVYVIDYRDKLELRVWDPRGVAIGVEPPPPRRPTERGANHVGTELSGDPRDFRPQVGLEVHSDFLAIESTYGGSPGSGYAGEVPVRVGDGAIATFVRCDLRTGGDGPVAQRASTLFLIDCQLPPGTWTLGDACHLVILGGTPAGMLTIHAAPTATVTVDGPIARRAGNVWILTSIPYGTPFDVDGTTYHWEIDERSGSRTRGKQVNYIHVTSADGSSVSFAIPDGNYNEPGWWHGYLLPYGSIERWPAAAERAVRLATRTGSRRLRMLTVDETLEILDRSPRPLPDELAAAAALIPTLDDRDARETFVRHILAVATHDASALDAWVTTHADALRAARPGLQALLDDVGYRGPSLHMRSAMQFLADACVRSGIDLALDTAKADREVQRFAREGPPAWGIPASHSWWSKPKPPPAPEPEDPSDPRWR